MRVFVQLKKEFSYLKTMVGTFLFCYMVAPILLGFMYGALYEKMLTPEFEVEAMTVYVAENPSNQYVPLVKEMLHDMNSLQISIKVVQENKLMTHVEADKKSLGIRERKGLLDIVDRGPMSNEKTIIIKSIEPVMQALVNNDYVQLNVEEKKAFMARYLQLVSSQHVTVQKVEIPRTLNSYETMMVTGYIALSLFIALSFGSNFIDEREKNILSRLFSMNIEPWKLYLYSVISVYVVSCLLILIFSLIAYGLILKMPLPWLKLTGTVLLHGGLVSAIYGFFIGWFKKTKTLKSLITPVFMVMMILGGSFFPIDNIESGIKIARVLPNYNLYKIYEGIFLQVSAKEMSYHIIYEIVFIVACLLLGMFKFTRKGERAC